MTVLLIEDDTTLSENISEALKAENWPIERCYDGALAAKLLQKKNYACVIMDVNLPGKNGFDVCKEFRAYNKKTPVIMLTAFGELEDKVQGFDCGADDYLTKPFYMRELMMRVGALINRYQRMDEKTDNSILVADDITLNDSKKEVLRQGKPIALTPREYQILHKLAKHKGEIISKADLIEEIWGRSFDANTNTIEVYVNFLRNKLDKPFGKNTIKTKVGYGYYLDVK